MKKLEKMRKELIEALIKRGWIKKALKGTDFLPESEKIEIFEKILAKCVEEGWFSKAKK